MKKIKTVMIVLVVCILVVTVIIIGYSRVYFVKINDVYKLEYGNKFIPVIQELYRSFSYHWLYRYKISNP